MFSRPFAQDKNSSSSSVFTLDPFLTPSPPSSSFFLFLFIWATDVWSGLVMWHGHWHLSALCSPRGKRCSWREPKSDERWDAECVTPGGLLPSNLWENAAARDLSVSSQQVEPGTLNSQWAKIALKEKVFPSWPVTLIVWLSYIFFINTSLFVWFILRHHQHHFCRLRLPRLWSGWYYVVWPWLKILTTDTE